MTNTTPRKQIISFFANNLYKIAIKIAEYKYKWMTLIKKDLMIS